MTDAEIFAIYVSREIAANATPQGADVEALYRQLANETGKTFEDIASIVIGHTFFGAC